MQNHHNSKILQQKKKKDAGHTALIKKLNIAVNDFLNVPLYFCAFSECLAFF